GLWIVPHPHPVVPLRRQQAPDRTQRSLYRRFCALDPTDLKALTRFADSYGLLGDGGPGDDFTLLVRTSAHPLGARGMSHQAWRYAITLMGYAVELWDAINTSSPTILHPLISERVERIQDEHGDHAFYVTPPDLTALRMELGLLPPDFAERGYE